MSYPIQVYISYASADKRLKDQLRVYLKAIERQGIIGVWDDQQIEAADDWHATIHQRIDIASIVIILVTPDYLASDWLYREELPHILRRKDEGRTKVIPVILKKCDWHYAFGSIQALPQNGKPISDWKVRGDAYIEVADGVKRSAYQFEQFELFLPASDTSTAETEPITMPTPTGKTLLIHGHAKQDRLELTAFLQNSLGLPKPIVMGEEMTPGMALPVKFDTLASEVEFAIALLTPDDEGKAVSEPATRPRARQNTLIEFGWFWGRLGLSRLLILVKSKVEIPTDLQGLEYHQYTTSPDECSEKIRAFYKSHNVAVS